VLKITVQSERAVAAYILRLDEQRSDAGVIIDGGRINEPFLHRVARDGELFLFVELPLDAEASVVLEPGPYGFVRPSGQAVAVEFAEDFLTTGLFDPATNSESDRQLLATIQPMVEEGILTRLREVFDQTAVTILGLDEPRPENVSVLFYKPDRVSGDGPDSFQTRGTGSSECNETVIFGELLPRGTNVDPGNRDLNDTAVVYAGSFRGRGPCDPGLVLQSANNIINAFAVTGAHEIGHLLGLNHTALDGIMAVSPSLAVQRQLRLERSQIVLDVGRGLNVYTTVVQDPQAYFDSIFSPAGE
jgi:hypothetical protein